jgi:hypothetical protein
MIHIKLKFDSTAKARLNYVFNGKDHEHDVARSRFIPGTMLMEPAIDSTSATDGSNGATGGRTSGKKGKSRATGPAVDASALEAEMNMVASMHRGKGEKLFSHYILSLPEGEHLTDDQWQDVMTDYMEALGYDDSTKYCGGIHEDTLNEHCHITACRVKCQLGGPLVSDQNDYEKGMAALRRIEIKYGLTITPSPSENWGGAEPSKGQVKHHGSVEEAKKHDLGAIIRARINRAWDIQKPRTIAEFVTGLKAVGVDIKIRTNKNGEPEGISYKPTEGSTWMSGSKVKATRLTWKALTTKEGIKYDPIRHNSFLRLPQPSDAHVARLQAFQPLNKRQVIAVKATRARVRVYQRGPTYFAMYPLEKVLKGEQRAAEEIEMKNLRDFAKALLEALFGGRLGLIEFTEQNDPLKDATEVRDDFALDEGIEVDDLNDESREEIRAKIFEKDGEWISPSNKGGGILTDDMEVVKSI